MDKSILGDQMRQFFDLWAEIEKHYVRYAKSVGLTYLGLCILDIIDKTPENCTQKLICEQMHLPKQSVNQVIRYFWEQGYLEMKECAADRRNKAIWLSESGRKYADEILGPLSKAEEAAIGHIPCEQRQALIETMGDMEHSFRKNIELAIDERSSLL